MQTLAEKKRHLILPANSIADIWPLGWKFPGPPWPPGWPRTDPLSVHLDVGIHPLVTHSHRVLFSCMIRDEFNELTDQLDGEMIALKANAHGDTIRLREADGDGTWSSNVLLKVGTDKTPFGVQVILDVEPHQSYALVTFTVGLYGWDGTSRNIEMEF